MAGHDFPPATTLTDGDALTGFSVTRLMETAVEKAKKSAMNKAGPNGGSIPAFGYRVAGLVPYNTKFSQRGL